MQIVEEMVLTVKSDINGASPQFTITCISTGGPATTVTWTRDSTTVTEGTQTVLDDPMSAMYTHTLTVTGILWGLYTCTVSNNKPSSDSDSITVIGTVDCHSLSFLLSLINSLTLLLMGHSNNFFHMTISELDETWYTTSIYRLALPDKVSPSFTLWLLGYDQ